MLDTKALYEKRYANDPDAVTFDELSPEEQAAICEGCGVILDPETPIFEGDDVLCGVCDGDFSASDIALKIAYDKGEA